MKTSRKTSDSKNKGEGGGAPAAEDPTAVARVSHPARKQPRQARSKEMVAAILQAAAEVFAAEGYARGTTNRVAERAGVSVGSLYQYFPNKDALLGALLERHHADIDGLLARALDRLEDPEVPLEAGLRRMIDELVRLHTEDHALSRALASAVLVQSPVHSAHEHGDMLERVVRVLRTRPDVRAADYFAVAMILGQVTGHITRWLVHDAPVLEGLQEEVVQLLTRYLRAGSSPAPSPAAPRRR